MFSMSNPVWHVAPGPREATHFDFEDPNKHEFRVIGMCMYVWFRLLDEKE
jgi:hypothetical protein